MKKRNKIFAFVFTFVLVLALSIPCFALNRLNVYDNLVIDYLDYSDGFNLYMGNTESGCYLDIYTYRSAVFINLPGFSYSISVYLLSDGVWDLYSSGTQDARTLDLSNYDAIRLYRISASANPIRVGNVTFTQILPTENKGLSVFYHLFRASGVNDDYASVGVIIISSILILSLCIFIFKVCFGRKR